MVSQAQPSTKTVLQTSVRQFRSVLVKKKSGTRNHKKKQNNANNSMAWDFGTSPQRRGLGEVIDSKL